MWDDDDVPDWGETRAPMPRDESIKVVIFVLPRCPYCGSVDHSIYGRYKDMQYRLCQGCRGKFRVVER